MASDPYKQIGERVSALRRQAGFTQECLSEAAVVTPSYVAYIEAGTKKATLTILDKIARALDVPLWRLFADVEERREEQRQGPVEELVHAVRLLGRGDAAMLLPVVQRLASKRAATRPGKRRK